MKQLLITLAAGFISLVGCDNDKGCEYTAYEGTCYGEADGTFSFEGSVDGETITLVGNGGDSELAEGESAACALEIIQAGTGTCTPCLLDLGECGDGAWDLATDE